MAKDTYIRLRCKNEFKQQIESLASKENRTVSNYIENLLIQQIKENVTMDKSTAYKYELTIGDFNEKYREFLETSDCNFYLKDGIYFMQESNGADLEELGTLDQVEYYLDCQLIEQ